MDIEVRKCLTMVIANPFIPLSLIRDGIMRKLCKFHIMKIAIDSAQGYRAAPIRMRFSCGEFMGSVTMGQDAISVI